MANERAAFRQKAWACETPIVGKLWLHLPKSFEQSIVWRLFSGLPWRFNVADVPEQTGHHPQSVAANGF